VQIILPDLVGAAVAAAGIAAGQELKRFVVRWVLHAAGGGLGASPARARQRLPIARQHPRAHHQRHVVLALVLQHATAHNQRHVQPRVALG